MKKRIVETGKTLLIILLICTLLLLTAASLPREMIRSTPWLSSLLQPLAPVLGLPEAELTYVEDAQPVLDAAQPLTISVRNQVGRYTARWNFEALDQAYETLGGLLGQALDTAGEFSVVRVDRLPDALSQDSIFFDFGFQLPVLLLGSWLEASPEQTDAAGQLFILAEEDGCVNLYLSGEQCLMAPTAVQPEAMAVLLEQFRPDGSCFAFETESHLSALTLLSEEDPSLEAALSSAPRDIRYAEGLATALGFNAYDENRYTDSTGTTYFSESNCSLQVSPSGEVLLMSSSPDRFRATGATLEALVEDARVMVQLVLRDLAGEERIYLSGIRQEENRTICDFDYVLNGIPVSCGSKPAATVTFTDSAVTSLELKAVSFTGTGEPLKILPAAQAAAIVPENGHLILKYYRSADGSITAGWAK